MSGIVGIFGEPDKKVLLEMLKKLKHRGPDGNGIFMDDHVALGYNRLAILDVAGSHQPILNEERNGCIVGDTEIYHLSLRKLHSNHAFSTRSDTEIALHLYEELGAKFVSEIDGTFALAIYMGNRLCIGRDYIGIKPLYYGWKDGTFYFASELKALLNVVDEISEFPPGHVLELSVDSKDRVFRRFYQLPDKSLISYEFNEMIALLRKTFSDAVLKCVMSEVPVGCFISGGLDSSLITAMSARYIPNMHTFTAGIVDAPDLKYAKMAAEALAAEHHECIFDVEEMLKKLPEILYFLESFDFPLVRSAIPNYFISEVASKFVKVVLTGEGSDELFAGYEYLKSLPDIHAELLKLTSELHYLGLQRGDRMAMAHSISARMPFLDKEMIRLAFSMPVDFKLREGVEKYILRKAFENLIPQNILTRKKMKFSEGTKSSEIIKNIAEHEISDGEFEIARNRYPEAQLRNKEELYYFNIFRGFYPQPQIWCICGQTRGV